MPRAIDTSLLSGYKTKRDFDVENALINQKISSGNIENAQKGNIHATQMLSAAAASGDQNIYTSTKQRLADAGVDMSGWADDIETGAKQAQAARLAQSPLGSLLNAGLKAEGNIIDATGTMGNTAAGMQLTPLSQMLTGGGLGMGGAVPRPMTANATQEAALPPPALPETGDPVADFQQALAATQGAQGVSPAQDPALAGLGAGGHAPAQAQPFQQPAQRPGETNKAYMDRVNLAFEQHKANPSYIKTKQTAEKSGGALGDEIGDAAKTVNIMQTNLPMVMQRFAEMRQAAQDASYGMGINAEGEGWSADLSKSIVGSEKTATANSLLKQREAMGILPELGPQLQQAGVNGNKFLESIARGASGLELDAKPETKIHLIDGLETQYVNNLKATAAQLRNAGQPAPTDAEIEAMAQQAKAAVKQNPALSALSPSAAPADATQAYINLRNKGYSDEQINQYFAAKGIRK